MTIYRRRIDYGMSHDRMTSNITDEELAVVLRQMCRENPAIGERMVMGHLRSWDLKSPDIEYVTALEVLIRYKQLSDGDSISSLSLQLTFQFLQRKFPSTATTIACNRTSTFSCKNNAGWS